MIFFFDYKDESKTSLEVKTQYNPANIETSQLIVADKDGLAQFTEEELVLISEKLIFISPLENHDVDAVKTFTPKEFAGLPKKVVIDLIDNIQSKTLIEGLQNDLEIQEVLQDELLYKQKEFDATKEIALELTSDKSFEERIENVAKTILEFFDLDSGIFVIKEDLYFQVVYDSRGVKTSPFIARKGTFINWIRINQIPLFCRDLHKDLRFKEGHEIDFPELPVLAQPITSENNPLHGVFFLFCKSQEQHFSPNEIEEINTFFSTITPLIENAIIKKELEHMYLVKSQFMANMSHELRTPLNGIIGFADIMMLDELSEEHLDYVKTIKESGQHLLSLINNILDITKLEAKEFVIEYVPVNIAAILKDSMSPLIPKGKEKGIELIAGDFKNLPELAFGDPTKIKQIALNLISNSVKFTEEGSVTISAFTKAEDSDVITISITITDTGIGIPQDKIADIFEPFKQADGSMKRRHEGTGLGLSISQKLIQLHGGEKIEVRSTEGKGSSFTFAIELLKENPNGDEESAESTQQIEDVEENATELLDETGTTIIV